MLSSPKAEFDHKTIMLDTQVIIEKSPDKLSVVITTPRLVIRPVCAEDVDFYQDELWGDEKVVEKFAAGKVRLYKDERSKLTGKVDYALNRIVDDENSWVKRWQNNNPYSGMTVTLRESFGDLKAGTEIGHVILGGGELAYLFASDVWGNRFGSEAVCALTRVALPKLYLESEDYRRDLPNDIEATTRKDHKASQSVLDRAGLTTDGLVNTREFDGKAYERLIYKAKVLDLVNAYKTVCEPKALAPQSQISSPNPKLDETIKDPERKRLKPSKNT